LLNGFPRVRSTHIRASATNRSYLRPYTDTQITLWINNPYPQCRGTYYSTTVLRDAPKYSILDHERIHTSRRTIKASRSHLPLYSAESPLRGSHCAIPAYDATVAITCSTCLDTEDISVIIKLITSSKTLLQQTLFIHIIKTSSNNAERYCSPPRRGRPHQMAGRNHDGHPFKR
jgi:hypothetical protein